MTACLLLARSLPDGLRGCQMPTRKLSRANCRARLPLVSLKWKSIEVVTNALRVALARATTRQAKFVTIPFSFGRPDDHSSG